MSRLAATLQRAAGWLRPQRRRRCSGTGCGRWPTCAGIAEADGREGCARELDALLDRLSAGDVEGFLAEEARRAEREARRGDEPARRGPRRSACWTAASPPSSSRACPDREALAETLVALDELGDRRLEALLAAQEDESSRRLVEAQEQAARAAERAREVQRANEALRRAEAESRHRAEQIGLLSSVAHRIAAIREPEELMQQAARPDPGPHEPHLRGGGGARRRGRARRALGRAGRALGRHERRPRPGARRAGSSAGRCACALRRWWATWRGTRTTTPTCPARAPRW